MAKIQYKILNISYTMEDYDDNYEDENLYPYICLDLDYLTFPDKSFSIISNWENFGDIRICLTLTPQDFFDLTGIEWKVSAESTIEELEKETDKIKEILLNKVFILDLGIKNTLYHEKQKPNKKEIIMHFPHHFTLKEAKQLCLKYVYEEKNIKIIGNWNNDSMLLITVPDELNAENILTAINKENNKNGVFACYNFENELFLK